MRKEDFTQQFVTTIKQKIFQQFYKIGDTLPSHRQLAEDFGFSRSVINVGIARLVSEGYLTVQARQKTLVNNFMKAPSLIMLRDITFFPDTPYKKKIISDILLARKLVELESVRLAAELGASTMQLNNIISMEKEILKKGNLDYKMVAQYDFAFHNHLIEMSQNAVYASLMNVFGQLASEMTENFYKNRIDLFDYYVQAHQKIEQEIKNKQADNAVAILKEILEHGESAYKF